jgi:hypothetical protein
LDVCSALLGALHVSASGVQARHALLICPAGTKWDQFWDMQSLTHWLQPYLQEAQGTHRTGGRKRAGVAGRARCSRQLAIPLTAAGKVVHPHVLRMAGWQGGMQAVLKRWLQHSALSAGYDDSTTRAEQTNNPEVRVWGCARATGSFSPRRPSWGTRALPAGTELSSNPSKPFHTDATQAD